LVENILLLLIGFLTDAGVNDDNGKETEPWLCSLWLDTSRFSISDI
jgi:hypothetical protein